MILLGTPTQWMTPGIMEAKTLRHNPERALRTRIHLDRSPFKHHCHQYNVMMTKALSKYCRSVNIREVLIFAKINIIIALLYNYHRK